MKRVSIKDVAREVGVSITTVSRALNGYSDVSEKTKQKILETVERMNYAPDMNARSLGGKADTTIALLTSELMPKDENGFVYGLIKGVFQSCSDLGCEFMLLATTKAKQEKLSFLQLCKRKNLSGLVVTGLRSGDPYYDEILASKYPCALIDMNANGEMKCKVTIDNIQAAKEAVEYLIGLGHKNIAMLNGNKAADVCAERYSGYVAALLEAKIPLRLDYMRYCDFSENTSYEMTRELLSSYPEITALFCASDMMAVGALRAAASLNLRVPEDISVVGFDDIPLAPFIGGGITTIHQSPRKMGEAGGEAVWKMLHGEKVEKEIILPHEVIVRGTAGKVRE